MYDQERGKRMALTNLAVFGGAFFTPILVGKISYTIGWDWSFYFVAIFSAVCLPLVFFFVPETAFRRSAHLNTDMASSDDLPLHPKPSGGYELDSIRDEEHISPAVPAPEHGARNEEKYFGTEVGNINNHQSNGA